MTVSGIWMGLVLYLYCYMDCVRVSKFARKYRYFTYGIGFSTCTTYCSSMYSYLFYFADDENSIRYVPGTYELERCRSVQV